jgi:hypothetical protein
LYNGITLLSLHAWGASCSIADLFKKSAIV